MLTAGEQDVPNRHLYAWHEEAAGGFEMRVGGSFISDLTKSSAGMQSHSSVADVKLVQATSRLPASSTIPNSN